MPAPLAVTHVPPFGQSPSLVHAIAVSLLQILSGIVWCTQRTDPVSRSSATRRPFVHGTSECDAMPTKTRLPATVGDDQIWSTAALPIDVFQRSLPFFRFTQWTTEFESPASTRPSAVSVTEPETPGTRPGAICDCVSYFHLTEPFVCFPATMKPFQEPK